MGHGYPDESRARSLGLLEQENSDKRTEKSPHNMNSIFGHSGSSFSSPSNNSSDGHGYPDEERARSLGLLAQDKSDKRAKKAPGNMNSIFCHYSSSFSSSSNNLPSSNGHGYPDEGCTQALKLLPNNHNTEEKTVTRQQSNLTF